MRQFRLRHARASNRQEPIQTYCCEELHRRGLLGARIEVILPGAYRDKVWDVGRLADSGEVTLGISCKSIISNHAGTVPNRIDDMLGEAVNLHRRWPRAVIGYLFMMARTDESQYQTKRRAGLIAAGSSEFSVLRGCSPERRHLVSATRRQCKSGFGADCRRRFPREVRGHVLFAARL